jgi:hypothetical protein
MGISCGRIVGWTLSTDYPQAGQMASTALQLLQAIVWKEKNKVLGL